LITRGAGWDLEAGAVEEAVAAAAVWEGAGDTAPPQESKRAAAAKRIGTRYHARVTPSGLEQMCGQLLVVGFAGQSASAAVRREIARSALGGVVLFKRNIGPEMTDIARLNDEVAKAAPAEPLLIAVDQEGGRVARIGPPAMKLPPMLSLEDHGEDFFTDLADAQSRELLALGFTMSFAPVLDVHSNEANPVIGDRAFGRDPASATPRALAFARGMRQAGLLSCGKHFPGHGDTSQDSHLDLPTVSHPKERLRAVELEPFRRAAAAGVDSMMTAHVRYPAWDDLPATLSHRIATDVLRDELGFRGVLFSDDLEMKALSARMSYSDSACGAIAAGCDALLVCASEDAWIEAREALTRRAEREAAFRERCSEALGRFLAMRRRCRPSPITDRAELMAQFGRRAS
jgi:beta-N-acetylhexosaminidase